MPTTVTLYTFAELPTIKAKEAALKNLAAYCVPLTYESFIYEALLRAILVHKDPMLFTENGNIVSIR